MAQRQLSSPGIQQYVQMWVRFNISRVGVSDLLTVYNCPSLPSLLKLARLTVMTRLLVEIVSEDTDLTIGVGGDVRMRLMATPLMVCQIQSDG